MDGWRALQQVSQLRWTLLAKGSPVLNESELAAQILEILIKVCQYFPSRYVVYKNESVNVVYVYHARTILSIYYIVVKQRNDLFGVINMPS